MTAVNGARVNEGPPQEMHISPCLLASPMSMMEIQCRAEHLALISSSFFTTWWMIFVCI